MKDPLAILRAELRRLFRWLKVKGITAVITYAILMFESRGFRPVELIIGGLVVLGCFFAWEERRERLGSCDTLDIGGGFPIDYTERAADISRLCRRTNIQCVVQAGRIVHRAA